MKNQRGYATLAVSLILLFLITINTFISSKGSLLEQQSSNNAYYAEQAFQNAEKGLAKVVADINAYLTANPDTQLLSDIPQGTTNQTVANVYATSLNGNILTSTGSINGMGTRKVAQFLAFMAGTPGGPAALNALGNITAGGNVSATSVKAGGTVTTGGSSSVSGANTSNATEFKVKLLDHSGNFLLDSGGKQLYRSMTTEEYFMYFFGGLCPTAKAANDAMACEAEAKQTIQDDPKGYVCASTCNSKVADDAISAAYNAGKRRFWLEGGIDHKLDMGTVADPVLILVMNVADNSKAAQINANSTITGILYVDVDYTTTNCSCTGTAEATSVNSVDDFTSPLLANWTATRYPSNDVNSSHICSVKKGCSQSISDSYGNTKTFTSTQNQKLYDPSTLVTSYGKKITATYGTLGNITLNTGQPAVCTVTACTETATQCTPMPTANTVVGSTAQCSYISKAVTNVLGAASPVQIEVVGTWNGSGTGNAVLKGAAITSGNYQGQGTIQFIENSTAVTNAVLGGLGGSGMNGSSTPATVTRSGWTDMKE